MSADRVEEIVQRALRAAADEIEARLRDTPIPCPPRSNRVPGPDMYAPFVEYGVTHRPYPFLRPALDAIRRARS